MQLTVVAIVLLTNINFLSSFHLNNFLGSKFSLNQQNEIKRRENNGELNMMFDFFKQRTQEGLNQVKNIATKTLEGKLGEALLDSAEYVKERRKIDYENLKQLTNGLSRSRDRLLKGISDSFSDGDDVDITTTLTKLEDVLLQADIGVATTSVIIEDLRSYARREGLKKEDILPVLRARLIEALTPPTASKGMNFAPIVTDPSQEPIPTVIFVIGANGMGKTTTIGKIASRLHNELNMTVLLGACDTFRAAAVEQLGEWAIRANVSIEVPFENERGGEPMSVVTRSIQRAKLEKFDVVIIDTSGRLSNNFGLTMQLKQMKEAIQKEIPSAPHETLLVVDGSLGRNAVEQAAAWREHVGVTGLVITKLDGTARGGFVVSVVKDLGLPVKFIGIGEKISDLRDFQPELFVDALLGNDMDTSEKLKVRMNKMMNNMESKASLSNSNSAAAAAAGGGGAFSSSGGMNVKTSRTTANANKAASSSSSAIDTDPAARLRAAFAQENNSNEGDGSFGTTTISMVGGSSSSSSSKNDNKKSKSKGSSKGPQISAAAAKKKKSK